MNAGKINNDSSLCVKGGAEERAGGRAVGMVPGGWFGLSAGSMRGRMCICKFIV